MRTEKDSAARKQAREATMLRLARAFPHLPDTARVPSAVVDLLFGWSRATRWRRIREQRFVKPSPEGFLVGQIRPLLDALAVAPIAE